MTGILELFGSETISFEDRLEKQALLRIIVVVSPTVIEGGIVLPMSYHCVDHLPEGGSNVENTIHFEH